jgi:hypothetical protein
MLCRSASPGEILPMRNTYNNKCMEIPSPENKVNSKHQSSAIGKIPQREIPSMKNVWEIPAQNHQYTPDSPYNDQLKTKTGHNHDMY